MRKDDLICLLKVSMVKVISMWMAIFLGGGRTSVLRSKTPPKTNMTMNHPRSIEKCGDSPARHVSFQGVTCF